MTERQLLVDELANELRHYRHSPMASAALAEHILAIPRIADALALTPAKLNLGPSISTGTRRADDE